MTGGSGADLLYGDGGDDTLYGGDGADTLYDKAGLDTMTGGSGADIYVFETAIAFSDVDVITDFSTGDGDVLDLTDILDTAYDPMSDAIGDFVSFTESSGHTFVSVDRDGTGREAFIAWHRSSSWKTSPACRAWNRFADRPEIVSSITSRQWAQVNA